MVDHDERDRVRGTSGPRHRVRMPGFISQDEEVGLGEVVGRATSAFGVPACGGCLKRAAILNHWMTFIPAGRNRG